MREEEIVEKYLNGETMKNLSKESGLSVWFIRKILVSNNIELRNRSEIKKNIDKVNKPHRTHTLNEDYFKTWSSNMSYMLGFIYADGYVVYNEKSRKYMLRFGLAEKDLSLLEKIKEELEYSGKIRKEKTNYTRANGECCYSYILAINSKKLVKSLVELGLYNNKSLTKTLPEIPKEFFGDFIRGYFDGNGTIDKVNNSIRVRFASGSKSFLIQLEEYLSSFGVKRQKVYSGKKERENVHTLEYCSDIESLKIYQLMYKDLSSLKLDRKYNLFKSFY